MNMKRKLWHLKIIFIPVVILAILVMLPFITFYAYPKSTALYLYLGIMSFLILLRSKYLWLKNYKTFDKVATILIWIISPPMFIILGFLAVVIVFIYTRLVHRVIYFLSATFIFVFGIRLKKFGILPNTQFIAISNHCSTIDDIMNPLLMGFKKWKVVFAKEITRIPFVGYFLKYIGIPIARKEFKSRNEVPFKVKSALNKKFNVLIFPEGRRLPVEKSNEYMYNFNDGAFSLSKHTGIPILPLVISWTFLFKPRNGQWWFSPRTIEIYYLDLTTAGKDESIEEFKNRVRSLMIEKLKDLLTQ